MKSILITGGGGFIGRCIKEALDGRYRIFAPRSFELELRDYDMVSAYIDRNKIESVVHCATYNDRDSWARRVLEADLRMFFNLEKISRKLERLIYFGSGAEFDKRFDITMAAEDDIGRSIPADGYGFAKYIMTKSARASENIYNLRLLGTMGPYADWRWSFVSNLCCKAAFDLPLTVRRECCFDFIYSGDVAQAVEWILENKPPRHDYNLCNGSPVKLTELAGMVLAAAGKELEIKVLNEGQALDYTASNARLRHDMPSLEITDYKKAAGILYEYYSDKRDMIDFDVLKETR